MALTHDKRKRPRRSERMRDKASTAMLHMLRDYKCSDMTRPLIWHHTKRYEHTIIAITIDLVLAIFLSFFIAKFSFPKDCGRKDIKCEIGADIFHFTDTSSGSLTISHITSCIFILS